MTAIQRILAARRATARLEVHDHLADPADRLCALLKIARPSNVVSLAAYRAGRAGR